MAAGNSVNWTLFFKGQNKSQQIPVLKVILMQTLNALLLLLNWKLPWLRHYLFLLLVTAF